MGEAATEAEPIMFRQAIDAFIEAMTEVVKIQCRMDVAVKQVVIEGPMPAMDGGLIAITKMKDPKISGALALACPKAGFFRIMEGLLGEDFSGVDKINSELQDGAAELLNIVFGSAIKRLNKMGFQLDTSIPTIVKAHNVKPRFLTPSPTAAIDFDVAGEIIQLRVGYTES